MTKRLSVSRKGRLDYAEENISYYFFYFHFRFIDTFTSQSTVIDLVDQYSFSISNQ